MSQTDLANALTLTFQQVQKYERGANRVSASKLYTIAGVLGVEVSYFFAEMPPEIANGTAAPVGEVRRGYEENPLNRRETLELMKDFSRIEDEAVRRHVRALVKALVREPAKPEQIEKVAA